MARKIFCDGCDNEIKNLNPREYERKVCVEHGETTIIGETFDLCASCASDLIDRANPARWPRAAKPYVPNIGG
jgi:hypothetical protein